MKRDNLLILIALGRILAGLSLDQHNRGSNPLGGQPIFNNLTYELLPANPQPDKGNWLGSFVTPYLYTASLNS